MLVLLSGLLPAGCGSNFDMTLNAAARPYRFSIAGWEFRALGNELDMLFDDDNTAVLPELYAGKWRRKSTL